MSGSPHPLGAPLDDPSLTATRCPVCGQALPASEVILFALTARQRAVLRCAATGMSNAQIGASLGMTGKTANTHMTAILRRLGVATRIQAVIRALGAGMIE